MLTPKLTKRAAPPHPTPKFNRIRFDTVSHSDLAETPMPPDAGFPRVRGYDIIAVLGIGGMGIVYEARHRQLQRRVALKMLHANAVSDAESRDRFRAEAEAVAKLQHPNIIQVFEVGTIQSPNGDAGTSPFIALEYVDGWSLAKVTAAPQTPEYAARMVEQLARAAHAAHCVGVVHRDLKPANVLLTRTGEPKIADFGLAKQLATRRDSEDRFETQVGIAVGTPEYMAPEQVAGGAASEAIDIYALGVILYELLTARVPFQGPTPMDTMDLVRRQEPVPPRRLQPGLPRDLETICLKCLAKEPGERYGSAEALADDLARWAAGRPIQARPVGPVERTLRWAKRNPTVAALSMAVVIVGIAGFAGVMWNWQAAERHAADAEARTKEADVAKRNAETAAELERRERYRVNVVATSGALRLYDTVSARRALDNTVEEYRDWIWHLLRAQLDQSRSTFGVPGWTVQRAAFTPDARWATAWGTDGTVRIWNVAERKEEPWPKRDFKPARFALSVDAAKVAYAHDDGAIILRDRATGAERTLDERAGVLGDLGFSPDGTRVWTISDRSLLCVWDAGNGRRFHSFQAPQNANPLVLSPTGRFVAARDGEGLSTARIWNLETGREHAMLGRHEGSVHGVHFSPNGSRILTTQRFPDNAMHLWDVATGKRIARLTGHENQVTHVEFSRDGSRLLTTSIDRSVRLWDVSPTPVERETGAIYIFHGHSACVNHAAFSPDGTRIVSSSDDRTVRHWNAKSGELIAVHCGHTDRVLVSAFRDEATIVSASGDGTVRLWDIAGAESGNVIRGHDKFVYHVAFLPRSERIASAGWDGTARIFNPTTGQELKRFEHGKVDRYVSSVAVDSEERFLATLARPEGGPEMSVRLWNLKTGAMLKRWALPNGWQGGRIAFAPKGAMFAAGGVDGHIRLWDATTLAETAVLEVGPAPVRDLAFSPDGTMLAAGCDDGDGSVRIWDVAARKEIHILRGHTRCVYSVAWNHAGTMLASGSLDNNVRLWDVKTWSPLGDPLPQGADVFGVAFTADDKSLACACADNLIRVWDATSRRELGELSGHRNYVHHLAFSPNGTRMVSASGDHTLRVWDTLPKAERLKR